MVVHDLEASPNLSSVSAGYELGLWRTEGFAAHLIEWLPEFALTARELADLNSATAVRLLRRAAQAVYQTDRFEKRGEFGELILHAVLRQVAGSLPAISKIYFKDSPNDTVKGYDAVHVVPTDDQLELWLGEAKFYSDLQDAIRDAVASLTDHIGPNYLRSEFQTILNKIDDDWPHAASLRTLLDPNTSLDDVFGALCMPVLLTYDSPACSAFDERCEEYLEALAREAWDAHRTFLERLGAPPVRMHLFLTPLQNKAELMQALHSRLQNLQAA